MRRFDAIRNATGLNDGGEEAHSVQWFEPALNIDCFFESYFGLAQDGKLRADGSPSFLQVAVMAPYCATNFAGPGA